MDEQDDNDMLAEARERAAHLSAHLPDRIQIGALSLNSELPFRAVSLRESLFHRMCQLATATVEQFEAGRGVPATLLTRASMETFALLYGLHIQSIFLGAPASGWHLCAVETQREPAGWRRLQRSRPCTVRPGNQK